MRYLLFSFLLAASYSTLFGQCDYTTSQYGVNPILGQLYGSGQNYDGQDQSLYMDIFTPTGNVDVARPVIIWVFGGGFNSGNRQSVHPACQYFTARGFVTAAIDYRIGYHTPSIGTYPYTYDSAEVIRATYRALQDAKSAIRFLKARHTIDSTHINNFFIGGFSAGAITSLHAAFANDPSQKPAQADSIEAINYFLSDPTRPDLGSINGFGNINGYDATVRGVVNYYGALFDTTFIQEPNKVALYNYHQTLDPVVPAAFNRPYWGIGLGIPANYNHAFGSIKIDEHANNIGYSSDWLQTYIHTGNSHSLHNSLLIFDSTANFLENIICVATASTKTLDKIEAPILAPNPVSHELYILNPGAFSDFKLYNNLGILVQVGKVQNSKIDLSQHSSGFYYVVLISDNEAFSRKIQIAQ